MITSKRSEDSKGVDIVDPFMVINKCNGSNVIVLVTEWGKEFSFSGIVINSENTEHPMGMYKNNWNKQSFQKFVGSVTITQEN